MFYAFTTSKCATLPAEACFRECRSGSIIKIEQFFQKRLLLFTLRKAMRRLLLFGTIVLRKIAVVVRMWDVILRGALYDFIQFAAVEPDAPAFQAKVYFHAVALGGLKRFFTKWTKHFETVMSYER